LSAGATGGKLLGAGGGGFVLIFASPEHQGRIRTALSDYLEIPFAFEFVGTQIIFCDHASRGEISRAM
jgi:D-glycero-alpha-D-manno-heptose-7-phosphate kinase